MNINEKHNIITFMKHSKGKFIAVNKKAFKKWEGIKDGEVNKLFACLLL